MKAVCAVGTRTWWLDWLEHDSEGEVRESGAAFGCLAELATRRGSPLRPVPLQEVPSSTSSLPRRLDVPAESCQPPYSREWLLAHRAHCGGSPLRPTVLHLYPAELLSISVSAATPALDATTAARVAVPHASPAGEPCGERACSSERGWCGEVPARGRHHPRLDPRATRNLGGDLDNSALWVHRAARRRYKRDSSSSSACASERNTRRDRGSARHWVRSACQCSRDHASEGVEKGCQRSFASSAV